MSRPLFVFRPEPGLRVTLETAAASGLQAIGCPLFEVEPVAWSPPDSQDFDALLVGSSNVFRHGGRGLDRLAGLPVYAVGEATADSAREKGFRVARTGRGGLQAILDDLGPRDMTFLRLAGEAMVELVAPPGITIVTRIVYRMRPLPIEETIAKRLSRGGVALLHSGVAATRLLEECKRISVDRSGVTIAALGPRIADLAGDGWQAVHTASQPVDAQLLALAKALCNDGDTKARRTDS